VIDNSVRQIIEVVLRHGAEISGPVPLPTETNKYTVNRSSFIHKDAREQFEMRVHKRLIDILNPNQKVIDSLMSLNLPAGVDIEIKM
jgi:small subunit ribosomal protein S10